MKIIRDGREIELTPDEMRKAYEEQDMTYYEEDLRSRYDVNDEQLCSALDMFKHWLERCDPYFDAYWGTMDVVCRELGIKEKDVE